VFANQNKKRGIAIYFNKRFKLMKIIAKDKFHIFCKFSINDNCFYLINVHAPNRNSEGHTKFIQIIINYIIKIQKNDNLPIITCGDFNCNSLSTKLFGVLKKLFYNFDQPELITRKFNSIDHILVYKMKIKNVSTNNYEILSDHNLINASINIIINNKPIISKKLKIKSIYKEKMEMFNLRNYKEVIFNSSEIIVSKTDNRMDLNLDILLIRMKIKKLNNLKKKSNYTIDLEKSLKVIWKNLLKKYQKESFDKLKVAALKNPFLFLKKKKSIIDINEDDLKSLSNNNTNSVFNDLNYWFGKKKDKLNIELEFKIEELIDIINFNYKNKKNSSAGVDLINYDILYQISKIPIINGSFKEIINDFNNILNNKEEFPKDFTTGRIIPIEKNDGGFRPICINNSLYKIFSIMLLNKINFVKINKNQLGFKQVRGCDINLVKFTFKIDELLKKNKNFFGTLWDFKGAFNMVPFNFINLVLKMNGFKKNIRNIINKMLNSYIYYDRFKVLATSGTQQGMPISPFIFNLCIDILLNKLNKFGTFLLGYADDIVTICLNIIQDNQTSDIVEEFCMFSGFILNHNKTQLFYNYMDSNVIFKYLGINFQIINNRLSTKNHILVKMEDVKIIINEILKKKKYLPIFFIILYLNSILSKLSYGSIIFYKNVEIIKKFKCYYFGKIKILLHLPKNTSDEILEKLGVCNLIKKIKIHKICTLKCLIIQDKIMKKIIDYYSFIRGYPGFPCNFNVRMINSNFFSDINNILLEFKLLFITYSFNQFSGEKLNIRARKNLLNVNKFYTINDNYMKIRKEVGYKFNATHKMIKNNKWFNINSLILNGILINSKEEVKAIVNNLKKIRWGLSINNIDLKLSRDISSSTIRLKILLIEKLFPTYEILNKYDSNIDPICRMCKNEIESIEHLLKECKVLNFIRLKYKLLVNNFDNINVLLNNINFVKDIWNYRNWFIASK
jgi:hypothetical protein